MTTHNRHGSHMILFAILAGSCLLSAGVDTLHAQTPKPPAPAATPAMDPAAHAAHQAAGTHPDAQAQPAGKGDPALAQQLSQLQAKVSELEAALAKVAPPRTAAPSDATMPGMGAAAPVAGPAMKSGMGGMKSGGGMQGMSAGATPAPTMAGMSAAPAPAGAAMNMNGMMGMMDKMMSMGGGAMPPDAPMSGGMGMRKSEMGGMGGGSMPAGASAAGMSGGGMGMDQMELAGMMGMAAMGSGAPGAMPQSALPGFPGASHLYHIGATGFFLDHPEHIALTTEQQAGLNKAKEQALLAKSTADRAVEQAEQALWTLTAADQPDATQIEAKIREIEKLSGDARLSFIRAVGDASKLLTDAQRKSLTGFAQPASAKAMATPAAAMPAGAMKDM